MKLTLEKKDYQPQDQGETFILKLVVRIKSIWGQDKLICQKTDNVHWVSVWWVVYVQCVNIAEVSE